jgi:hypothetical protein
VQELAPLLKTLDDLVRWLNSGRVPGILIGGVAASLLGRPRTTRDVDVLIILDAPHWQTFLDAGVAFGFKPRISEPIEFAGKSRVLLVRHEPSGIDVDVVFGALSFEEEAVRHQVVVDIGDLRVPLPTPEDLIVMKAVAHRPRDLIDIQSILDAHPDVDLKQIRHWLDEFSAALDSPGIYDDVYRLLANVKPANQ